MKLLFASGKSAASLVNGAATARLWSHAQVLPARIE
jgi:hypothetical protein